jgi:hypothetical protein
MTKPPVTSFIKSGTSTSKFIVVEQTERSVSMAGASIMLMVILNGLILQNAVVHNGSYKLLLVTIPFLALSAFDYIRGSKKIPK